MTSAARPRLSRLHSTPPPRSAAPPASNPDPLGDRLLKIIRVTVTPIAFRDPPLLNASGIHEPFALRSIIEIESDNG
ncbi:glucarate dehydratase, partial [Pseudomonas syringae pv. actinidiae]